MYKFHLIYNPYRMCSELSFKEDKEWIEVSAESSLSRVRNGHLQAYLPKREEIGWDGLMAELVRACGEDEITLYFTGTAEDLEDLQIEGEVFSKEQHADIRVLPLYEGNTILQSSAGRLEMAAQMAEKAKTDGYLTVFPERLQCLMNGLLLDTQTDVRVIELDDVDLSAVDFITDKNNWDMGIFTFRCDRLSNRRVRSRIREKFSGGCYDCELHQGHDRLLFLVCCTETELWNPDDTRNWCKDMLLSCGVFCDRLYLIERKEEEVLLRQIRSGMYQADNLSHEAQQFLEAVHLYHVRYAEQTRLTRQMDLFFSLVKEEGLLKYGYTAQISVDSALKEVILKKDLNANLLALGELYKTLEEWDFEQDMDVVKSQCITRLREDLQREFSDSLQISKPDQILEIMNRDFASAADQIECRYLSVYDDCIKQYCETASDPQQVLLSFVPKNVQRHLFLRRELEDCTIDFPQKMIRLFENKLGIYMRELAAVTQELKRTTENCMASYGISVVDYHKHQYIEKQIQNQAYEWLQNFGKQMEQLLDMKCDKITI